MTVTPAPTKGKGMNGSTKYITIIGILMTVILALGARQVEWGSVDADLKYHESVHAHGNVDKRLTDLEHAMIRFEERQIAIDEKLAAIAKATGAHP